MLSALSTGTLLQNLAHNSLLDCSNVALFICVKFWCAADDDQCFMVGIPPREGTTETPGQFAIALSMQY